MGKRINKLKENNRGIFFLKEKMPTIRLQGWGSKCKCNANDM